MNAILAGLLGAVAALAVAHGRASHYDNYVLLASSLLHGHMYIDALWRDASIDAVLFEGHRYVVNDPVPAVLIMPLVMLVGLGANQTLLACLLCGLAIGAAWALLERIGVTNRVTIWLVVFFLAGTDLLWCSMLGDVWFIAQTSAVAFTLLALCELAGKRRGWLVALWTALALGSRFTLVMALPVLLWWVWDGFAVRERRPRSALAFVLALLPFFVLWVAYNEARWHVPWDAGHTIFYHQDPFMGAPSGSPFGLANVPIELYSFFVVAPRWHATFPYLEPLAFGTALWFTSPALVFALLAREPRRLVVTLWIATLLVAGPSLLYYANGGSQFGMRHALDFEPFVLVLMGLAARHGRAYLWRVAQALIVWSVVAGAWGCWYWNTYVRADS
ncbi:MAG: hypothetical protein QOF71_1910 [Candidatus Eremiobacteraeota bacterium]|jgi:hypothetical protein|nr:hypothetical protein [Candidatus Eremiobacteraeota bacterium]